MLDKKPFWWFKIWFSYEYFVHAETSVKSQMNQPFKYQVNLFSCPCVYFNWFDSKIPTQKLLLGLSYHDFSQLHSVTM